MYTTEAYAIEALRIRYGLDKPVINCFASLNPLKPGDCAVNPLDTQFFIYLRNLAQGELGISFHQNRPVSDILSERLWNTIHLIGAGQILSILIGMIFGVFAAWKARSVIAGALVLEPHLLLADEPVSMLDVSIRAEIINLLADLRATRGISVIFITHDLGTVGYFADRVAVMYLGRIVELGTTKDVLENPQHPYTRALLSVIPVPNPRLGKKRIILEGETPNPIDLPSGCRFHPRCPLAMEVCKQSDPGLFQISESHQAACLLLVR